MDGDLKMNGEFEMKGGRTCANLVCRFTVLVMCTPTELFPDCPKALPVIRYL